MIERAYVGTLPVLVSLKYGNRAERDNYGISGSNSNRTFLLLFLVYKLELLLVEYYLYYHRKTRISIHRYPTP